MAQKPVKTAKKKKIGEYFLDKNLMTFGQLEEVLRKQPELKKRFGEVCVELGYIDISTLDKVLNELGIISYENLDVSAGDNRQNIKDFFTGYAGRYDIETDNKSIKKLFWEILGKIEDEETEINFLNGIGKLFALTVIIEEENVKKLKESIDKGAVNRLSIDKIKENTFIPLNDENVLTPNPFFDLYQSNNIVLATRATIIRLLSVIEEWGSEHKTTVRIDDIDIDKFFEQTISSALAQHISDIHIEWNPFDSQTEIKFRVDGLLRKFKTIPGDGEFHSRFCNKIFEYAGINTSDFLHLHDKKMAYEVMKKRISIRVSVVPVFRGKEDDKLSNVVLRLLYSRTSATDTSIADLGYDEDTINLLLQFNKLPYGMIILSGPTGSGKTTTLYSLLRIKKKEPVKIVTIEDPIEVTIPGITQVEVREESQISFLKAVRSFLRHDPDAMLIGEIRDKETAEEACRAALTGHLVYTTLHANTSSAAIPRLLDLEVNRQILASVIKVILSQRLIKKLCLDCRIAVKTDNAADVEMKLGLRFENFKNMYGEIFPSGEVVYIANAAGCGKCHGGYKGRTVIWEMLRINHNIQKALLERAVISEKELFAEQEEFLFRNVAINRIKAGVTTLEEVERFIPLNKLSGELF